MANRRKRNKNYKVPTTHEDFLAAGRFQRGIEARQLETVAVLHAAMRGVQEAFGPGYVVLDVISEQLPARFVENWARSRLAA